LTPELVDIHPMLGDLAASYKDHRYVDIVLLAQLGIPVNVDFPQLGAKFGEKRLDLQFGLIA
jgi:hypothetical protein